jgi:hypothetical protein
MATKKKPSPKAPAKPSRAKPPPPPPKKTASPRGSSPKIATQPRPTFDDALDEPLLDASGVFRAVTSVATAQRGGDEDEVKRFSDPSMIIEFEKKGVRDEVAETAGDSLSFDPESLLDDAQRAARRKRLAALATQKRR